MHLGAIRSPRQLGLFCAQNVLRELEQKKPQLDELVHTAENLKADSNRQQLHGKGATRSRFHQTNHKYSAAKIDLLHLDDSEGQIRETWQRICSNALSFK
ncbi:Dystrophin, isoforms A/C/F/G/H [Gryllus bimaculatus]|nr:Dystrophin, isoforms A/C/F/G/H [Gryllus bimaculatus]